MNLIYISNDDLLYRTQNLFQTERKIMHRRLYADLGFDARQVLAQEFDRPLKIQDLVRPQKDESAIASKLNKSKIGKPNKSPVPVKFDLGSATELKCSDLKSPSLPPRKWVALSVHLKREVFAKAKDYCHALVRNARNYGRF